MNLGAPRSARSASLFALASMLASSIVPRSAASSPDCSAAAHLRGDPDLVSPIENALRRREVSVGESTGDCDTPWIAVSGGPGGLTLRRENRGGTDEEVSVSSVSFAILLIESWVRSDLDRVLASTIAHQPSVPAERAPRAPGARGSPAVPDGAMPATAERTSPAPGAPLPIAPEPPRSSEPSPLSSDADLVARLETGPNLRARTLFVGARGEAGVSADGAAWWGGLARIGLALDSFSGWAPWIGLRGARSPRHKAADRGTSTARAEIAWLIGIDRPVTFGDLTLTPGAAIGAAWFESRRVVPQISPCVVEGTCAWEGGPIVPDGFKARHIGARTDLSIGAGRHLSPDLSVHLLFVLSLAPFSDGVALTPSYARDLLDVEKAKIALEPEPRVVARGSLSIEWGSM